jgi:hypothetical protein
MGTSPLRWGVRLVEEGLATHQKTRLTFNNNFISLTSSTLWPRFLFRRFPGMFRFKRLTWLCLSLTLALGGCNGSNSPGASSSGVPDLITPGKAPPDIAGTDVDNQFFQLRDYRGRVVLLSFWFSS